MATLLLLSLGEREKTSVAAEGSTRIIVKNNAKGSINL